MPEAAFMMVDNVVVFDHARHTLKVLTQCKLPRSATGSAPGSSVASTTLPAEYEAAKARISAIMRRIELGRPLDTSPGSPTKSAPASGSGDHMGASSGDGNGFGSSSTSDGGSGMGDPDLDLSGASSKALSREAWEASSNAGRAGYEGFVGSLKKHIVAGDII